MADRTVISLEEGGGRGGTLHRLVPSTLMAVLWEEVHETCQGRCGSVGHIHVAYQGRSFGVV